MKPKLNYDKTESIARIFSMNYNPVGNDFLGIWIFIDKQKPQIGTNFSNERGRVYWRWELLNERKISYGAIGKFRSSIWIKTAFSIPTAYFTH